VVVENSEHQVLPVMPLKDMVVFPSSITPLIVMRPKSLGALDAAIESGKRVFLVAQKSGEMENPASKDLYQTGCIAEILQVLRLPDNTAKVLVEGQSIGRLVDFFAGESYFKAYVVQIGFPVEDEKQITALRRTVLRQFEAYAGFSDNIPDDLVRSIRAIDDPLSFANSVANYSSFSTQGKQEILEAGTVDEKLILLSKILSGENELLEMESKILTQVKTQITKSQREYFLNEQLKIIENELGLSMEDDRELEELDERIRKCKMSDEAREKAQREVARMSRMAPMSPESTVSRTYIDWLLDIPWEKRTRDKLDLVRAQRILDEDHYGLEKVKERVVEFLAVLQQSKEMKGPILCLVGPPGVGKTSLARSVARTLGRKFVRVSLGGVRDEAEIRGHRRTYIGSLPGKIIQNMKKAGSVNPVFLLDEVDKMGQDFRGDPASALLETLDPEQNKSFNDHYLEVDYDLSQVMFITTANTMGGIPLPLLDRMEIIRIPGYTELEKRHIATQFLVPKQVKAHGFAASSLKFNSDTIKQVIDSYTREAGVRQLEREIAALCRKAARENVSAKSKSRKRITITRKKLREYLGAPKFNRPPMETKPEIGIVKGLAWTEVGGELLPVETLTMKGEGKLQLTGKLGDVMQESAKAALSYIRSNAESLGVPDDFQKTLDLHVHVPEGAIPKDGPSAGVALLTSMVSALSKRPVLQNIAMTGEITLLGKVLKIGGLKEKAIAARRARLERIIIPEDNREDLEEFPKELLDSLEFTFASEVTSVLDAAFAQPLKSGSAAKSPARRRPARGAQMGAS
jgi:ATP-dependent Lon protease